MDDGRPIGNSGHVTGKCPCGVYHGRRRYPQPSVTPLRLSEIIGLTNDELNDWGVLVRSMGYATTTPKGDDLC